MNIIRYDDIKVSQSCPLLYSNFRAKAKPFLDPKQKLIKRCIMRLFTKELELDKIPEVRGLASFWGQELQSFGELDKKDYNSIMIGLNEFYSDYLSHCYYSQHRVAAVSLPIRVGLKNVIYETEIPALFASGQGDVVPLYFTGYSGRAFKDNYIRIASALLERQTNLAVKDYFVAMIQVSPFIRLKLLKYRFNLSELDRAYSGLNVTIEDMLSGRLLPNTSYCSNCEVFSKCNL